MVSDGGIYKLAQALPAQMKDIFSDVTVKEVVRVQGIQAVNGKSSYFKETSWNIIVFESEIFMDFP